MSHIKQIHSMCDQNEQYSKSSSKRLFQSVFRILDYDELQISSFEQTETNGSKIKKYLHNQLFVQAVLDKLKQQNLDQLYPILKVQCMGKKGDFCQLDADDLETVFQKFGDIYTIYQSYSYSTYYVLYTSFCSAYVAMKLLNNFSLRNSGATLNVEWCNSQQYARFSHLINQYHSKIQWNAPETLIKKDSYTSNNQSLKQCKLTCRYDIQIENQKQFQVARRIIGSKGINMKRIIESALDQSEQKMANVNQILKLRLRGRGSGYKEGPQQLESDQQLHLCISAKDEIIYNYACQSVETLLQTVYQDYKQFTRKQGRCIIYGIKKSDVATQNSQPMTNNQNVMRNIETPKSGRMEAQKIQQYLELRNKARRQLNFAQADRIRNYLRACGVCLIDQKGRRGKAAEVTTWKYLA